MFFLPWIFYWFYSLFFKFLFSQESTQHFICFTGNPISPFLYHIEAKQWEKLDRMGTSPRGELTEYSSVKKFDSKLNSWIVLFFGGVFGSDLSYNTNIYQYQCNNNKWSILTRRKKNPNGRACPAVAYHEKSNRVFYHGGYFQDFYDDFYTFDSETLQWSPIIPKSSFKPSPRAYHSCTIYHNRYLLMFGGDTQNRSSNEIFEYDIDMSIWIKIKLTGCGELQGAQFSYLFYRPLANDIILVKSSSKNPSTCNNHIIHIQLQGSTCDEFTNRLWKNRKSFTSISIVLQSYISPC